ncbi:MAG: LCP family protein [Armatimonadota bacterium]
MKRYIINLGGNKGITKIKAVLLIFGIMAASIGIGAGLGYYYPGIGGTVKKITTPPFNGNKKVTILVLGEDNTGGTKEKPHGLSDTIILTSIDFESKRVTALSIPRDTRVELPGYGVSKINAAHVHGGPLLTSMVVKELTGINPDYYLKTNVDGFRETVDIVGGVEIDVEKNMNYDDNWGKLHIHLKKGKQILDGENAMGYVRFRHDAMGDITRIQRQQKFIKALAKRALEPSRLPKLPWTIKSIMQNVDTDMTTKDLIYLAKFASTINIDEVEMEMVPGTPQNIGGASYWVADTEKLPEIVQKLFLMQMIAGLPKVEILNGSGIAGAAQIVADTFRQYGYEVISVGNADSFDYTSSEVISHKPDTQGLENISTIVNTNVLKQEPNPSAQADVTIIIGKDCLLVNSGI